MLPTKGKKAKSKKPSESGKVNAKANGTTTKPAVAATQKDVDVLRTRLETTTKDLESVLSAESKIDRELEQFAKELAGTIENTKT
eukprot:9731939-Heterocapsa_arctica.AAC.1